MAETQMDYAPPCAIMFDLDGTLVDTMFAFADLASEMMAQHHGDDAAQARRRYLETSGIPFHQQLEVIHPGHLANSAASTEFELLKRRICDEAPMDAPTKEALATLRARGIKLVVSSNTGQEFVDEFVEREGVEFDLALGFDASQGLAKGRPHVERTLAKLKVEAKAVWFVGDSLKDGELAADCGLSFVGRVGTFSRESFTSTFPGGKVIEVIGELLDLIESCKQ
jgi:phosphoglycolate phosphatase-like HAD superfamily hydrolase